MIYFITNNKYVKIGYSNNVTKRLLALQTASSEKLQILFTIDGNYDFEKYLHNVFINFRKTGEWFDILESISLDKIEDLKKNYKPVITRKKQIEKTSFVLDHSLLEIDNNFIVDYNILKTQTELYSSEYVIIDSKAREYIQKEFTNAEAGRIFNMCDMVKSCYNLLFDKTSNQYHTKETLMSELDYTRNIFADFMKKLYKKSIIYYIDGIKNDKVCKWIMLNPTLARKRKTLHKDCVAVFEDLSKK